MQFKKVCVAGTFDHLHAGHEALLHKAFEVGNHVVVGITSDAFVTEYKNAPVRLCDARREDLILWLGKSGFDGRYDLVVIDDPYEPALSSKSFEVLVVSEESSVRAHALNAMRVKNGLTPLILVTVPIHIAKDGKPISSSRIREGDIDTKGNLCMPNSMREALSIPLGIIVDIPRYTDVFASVGDMTTKILLEKGIVPRLIIVDNKVHRNVYHDLIPLLQNLTVPMVHIRSGPGYIAKEAIALLFAKYHGIIDVEGEEDLLVLPVVVYAPIGSIVYYGQPDVGMVEVVVTQEKKEEAIALLTKFSVQ